MRKATGDALVLGSLIAVILIYSGVVLTLPLLLILPYGLVFLIALVIRLRKAARDDVEQQRISAYIRNL